MKKSWKDSLTGREYKNQPESFEEFLKKNNLVGRYQEIVKPATKSKKALEEENE